MGRKVVSPSTLDPRGFLVARGKVMAEYYRHSGRAPLAGAVAATLVGIASACLLAIIYSFGIVWIPIIYLSFLLTAGFGGITGVIVALLGQRVKIRNSGVLIAIALFAAAVAYYVAWGADLWAREPAWVEGDTLSAWSPSLLAEYVEAFYKEGAWSIGRTKTNVSGIFLAGIWLVEAAIIFGMAVLGVMVITGDSTFCEQCECWSQKKSDLAKYAHADEALLRSALEQGDFSQIAARPALAGALQNFLQVDAYVCPNCNNHCCVNVVKVTTTVNSKQEKETSTTTVVDRISLNAAEMKSFLAASLARPAPVQEVGPPPEPEGDSPPEIGPPPTPPNPGGIGPPPGFKG
jgi:hypothetical protein